MDSQREDFKAIATVNGLGIVLVSTRNSVLLIVPCITIASLSRKVSRIAIVDDQVKNLQTITAMDSLRLILIRT